MYRKKFLKIDGRNISYLEEGHGKPVVLIHGLGSDCMVWGKIIPHLDRHFRVLAMSLPFYGSYNGFGNRYTYHTYTDLVEKFIKEKRVRKPSLIGHSLGGVISVEYAARHPNSVPAIVPISAPLSDHSKPVPAIWQLGVDLALKSRTTQEAINWLESQGELRDLLAGVLFPEKQSRELAAASADMVKRIPVKYMAACFNDTFHWSFRKFCGKGTSASHVCLWLKRCPNSSDQWGRSLQTGSACSHGDAAYRPFRPD